MSQDTAGLIVVCFLDPSRYEKDDDDDDDQTEAAAVVTGISGVKSAPIAAGSEEQKQDQ